MPFLCIWRTRFFNCFAYFDAVEAAFGCQFGTVFRHERDLVGLNIESDFDNRLGHAHFEIEFAGDGFAEQPDIAVIDVTAVLAQVDGDAVCAGKLAFGGRPDGVRLVGFAGLANCRDMVDIYIKYCHFIPVSKTR